MPSPPPRMSDLSTQIDALLFALGRPLSRKELAQKLGVSPQELDGALRELGEMQRGVVLVDDGNEVSLRTAPGAAELIERVRKEEYSREIGKAGLEALSAVLYRGPLTRSEIDFIRGVNSSQTLRTLTVRGLVRKIPNPKDERSFLYEPTTELLAHLGVSRSSDLPEYAQVREKIQALENSYRDRQQEENTS
mgnify:CR=1 FL=1